MVPVLSVHARGHAAGAWGVVVFQAIQMQFASSEVQRAPQLLVLYLLPQRRHVYGRCTREGKCSLVCSLTMESVLYEMKGKRLSVALSY